MDISFADARKAVRRGTRSANRAIDVAHDVSQRKLARVRDTADDVIDASSHAANSAETAVRSAHDWMEEKPHFAALAALAAGVLIGVFLAPRR